MSNVSLVPYAHHVVLGAGPLGRATAAALVGAGHRVTLVNRSGTLPAAPAGVDLAAADITRPEALAPVLENAAAVYFCAQPAYHQWPAFFPALLDAVIEGAAVAGARLVIADNLYGYGPVRGPLTEELPLLAQTRKGRVRAEMHMNAMTAHRSGKVQVAVARGADFFGPHVDGSAVGARFFDAVAGGGAAEVFGDPDLPHSYTFIEDFASALVRLGTDPRALGEVWHVPSAPAVSTRQFTELACRLAGRPFGMRRVSRLEMHAIGLFIPAVREMIEMSYQFTAPFVVDSSKFTRMFGGDATPLETAIRATLASVQLAGQTSGGKAHAA